MKALLLMIFLISFPSGGIKTISRLNQYTAEAAVAYQQQDYVKAITAYEYILNELDIQDDQLRLNLAHTYFRADLLEQAQEQYYLLAEHQSNNIRAVVSLQLGNIAARNKKYKQALRLYKKALIAEPSSEAARYNFELLKKYLHLHPEKAETEPEEEQQPEGTLPPPAKEAPRPKQNPAAAGNNQAETDVQEAASEGEQQQQENMGSQTAGDKEKEQDSGNTRGDSEGLNMESAKDGDSDTEQSQQQGNSQNIAEGDIRASTRRERLRQANLSPEKARLLLDALRNSELQYMQQLPKKATKKPKKGLPNW